MGNEISSDERGKRYEELYKALRIIENDIKTELLNKDLSNKKYMPFALVNKGLCKKYKFLGKDVFDINEAKNKIFDYKDLVKKTVDKNFQIIDKKFNFGFPSNFIFINQDFLYVINSYIDSKYAVHLQTIFKTIIGGSCLIMKDANDKDDKEPYRYIILYQEIKENFGNEIDFFLYIKI